MTNRKFVNVADAMALFDRIEARLERLQDDLREKCGDEMANLIGEPLRAITEERERCNRNAVPTN